MVFIMLKVDTTDRTEAEIQWFHDLVMTHQGALVRFAKNKLGNKEKAREVVQNGFLKLWKGDLKELRACAVPWLFKTVRNEAIDIIREEKRFKDADFEEVCSNYELSEELMSKGEVFKTIFKLPHKQREIILLKFQSGFSYKEISGITGESMSNVGQLIHTGLKLLKESLNQETSNE